MNERTDNKKDIRIGIIGKGFVGTAVAHGFSHQTSYGANIKIYDIDPVKSQHTLEDTVNNSDFLFLSVPTPSSKDGTMDLSIVKNALQSMNDINQNNNNIVSLRSTVVPGTTKYLQAKFSNLRFVFNPEFLTERSAHFDFISQTRIVLGGKKEHVDFVKSIYRDRFGNNLSIIETDFKSAELTKYVCNTFFATKVSFLNEMKLLSNKIGANWGDVLEGFLRDGRVGSSHSQVPGPDGKLGFGGSCFPKDIQALINFGDDIDLNLATLKGAWETNLEVRPEKDWEDLIGRAVLDKEYQE